MNQVELIDKRKPREKHFLNQDGTITAKVYDRDVHFEKNGHYEDIDNHIVSTKYNFINETNTFKTRFDKRNAGFIDVSKDDNYLKLFPKNFSSLKITSKDNIVSYKDIANDIEFTYKVEPSRLKELIGFNCKETIPEKITYFVDTNLTLSIENNKIVAKKDNEKIFIMDTPFMEDAAGNKNTNITYELIKVDNIYELNLIYDINWLKDKNRPFPVIIDPTISDGNNTVYDTYIQSNIPNENLNDRKMLIVYANEYICRTLLKFDLPNISTGDNIVNATAYVNTYYTEDPPQYSGDKRKYYVAVHEITKDWNEETVTWNSFNNNYNEKIEDIFLPKPNSLDNPTNLQSNAFDLTNLVKKWYAGYPNNGVLLKKYNENLEALTTFIWFASKTFDEQYESNVRPSLEITYRNDNGLENYMTYKSLKFMNGSSHVNLLNGNLTLCMKVNSTISRKLPVELDLIYNTNDVILKKNYGFGIGYRINFYETITEKTINNKNYLEYVDGDGTIHYFLLKNGIYTDEDGLNLTATLVNNQYIIKNSREMEYIFTKLDNFKWYLTKIVTLNNNAENNIIYDSEYRIKKIIDSNETGINISYLENKIVFSSKFETVEIEYQDNHPVTILSNSGSMTINYTNGLISKIIDCNGLGYKYEYYNVNPFKVSKISELGINNEPGREVVFDYGYNITKLKNNVNETNTYLFNEFGNLIGLTNIDDDNNLNKAFGQKSKYYNENKDIINEKLNNKVIEEILPIKYSKNYISNGSFEDPAEMGDVVTPVGAENVGMENTHSGTNVYEYGTFGYIEFSAPEKGGEYVLSGYFKNEYPVKLIVSATNSTATVQIGEYLLPENEDYSKEDIVLNIPENVGVIGIEFETATRGYLDDIQLENGTVSNYHNYICNSDFSEGLRTWSVSSTEEILNQDYSTSNVVKTINDETKYLELISGPTIKTRLTKSIKLPGKEGDTYCLSFWYKNSGIVPTFRLATDDDKKAYVNINFKNSTEVKTQKFGLAIHDNEWLLFSEVIKSEIDYDYIEIEIIDDYNANKLLVTNFSLNKDVSYNRINYDENGEILSTIYNNQGISYEYDKNNELIRMSNIDNNAILYEYDLVNKSNMKSSTSSSGLSTEIIRDINDNPIKVVVSNKGKLDNIEDNGLYYIKQYGSDKYLNYNKTNGLVIKENQCNVSEFNFIRKDDSYQIKVNGYFLNNNGVLSFSKNEENASLFVFNKNNNGTYTISLKNNLDLKLSISEGLVTFSTTSSIEESSFYFEKVLSSKYLETSATYTDDGYYVKSLSDYLGNKTLYDIDQITGLPKTITKNGLSLINEYNSKKSLVSVKFLDRCNNFEYYNNGTLKKIKCNNKEYNYTYDNFLNIKDIKINENLLSTTEYDTNTNLRTSRTFGNGKKELYIYDNFQRLINYTIDDIMTSYKYDNQNNISEITHNGVKNKYYYDPSGKLNKSRYYGDNIFTAEYKYSLTKNNILSKNYKLHNQQYNNLNNLKISYEYDNDDKEIISNVNNFKKEIIYDKLERISEIRANDKLIAKYNYLSNGNKTSMLVKNMQILDDFYEYKYDDNSNIIQIKLNNNIIRDYYYDNYGQLIKMVDYETNKYNTFVYDLSGNILLAKEYNLLNDNLNNTDIYKYNNNNWKDQLTDFNNQTISYDSIGNPVAIGNVQLIWKGARILSSYLDTSKSLQVNYEYDANGIRTSKSINNIKTEFFLENNKIILEKTGEEMLYYLWDSNDNVYGIKYNDNIYYYLKDVNNNILGIIDSLGNVVGQYEYDSWGNITSVISNDESNIAFLNKIRFHSYYYDDETGWYYLNSRYYSPKLKRFINADSQINSEDNTYNLYMYCSNNPVNLSDPIGTSAFNPAIPNLWGAAGGSAVATASTLFNIGSYVAGLLALAALAVEAVNYLESINNSKTKNNKEYENNTKKQYCVYTLQDQNTVNKYVGITNDVSRRRYEHQHSIDIRKRSLELVVISPDGDNCTLTYYQARGLEQVIIEKHNMKVCGYNIINSISPKNKRYNELRSIGEELYGEIKLKGGAWDC